MTSLNVGDLVELHPGTGWFGTVLDVVESRPRWLLVTGSRRRTSASILCSRTRNSSR
jgi:hypothetical protein